MNETEGPNLHLQLIFFWSQSDLRWLPQIIKISKQKDGHNSVYFTEFEFNVVVEAHPQHVQNF